MRRHVIWRRTDMHVITLIHETDDGYLIELIERRTGRVLLGPKPARINPDKLTGYRFKQAA